MVPNIKTNFRNMFVDMKCRLCGETNEEESQQHQLDCVRLINNCNELYNDSITNYEDIYADVNKQARITKLFEKVLSVREKILIKDEEQQSNN